MKISAESIKSLLKAMDYLPEDGVNNIYYKKYAQHNNYIIRVNFNTQKIEYRENDVKAEDGIQWGDLTTSNFENSENFVVLECINRLLEKGYAPKICTWNISSHLVETKRANLIFLSLTMTAKHI